MKSIIYSKENPSSIAKVKELKSRHPKFTFIELGDKEGIKNAKEKINLGKEMVYLDEAKVVKKAKVEKVEKESKKESKPKKAKTKKK